MIAATGSDYSPLTGKFKRLRRLEPTKTRRPVWDFMVNKAC